VPTSTPTVGGAELESVAATSAKSTWAVGLYGFATAGIIPRWNGKSWKQQ